MLFSSSSQKEMRGSDARYVYRRRSSMLRNSRFERFRGKLCAAILLLRSSRRTAHAYTHAPIYYAHYSRETCRACRLNNRASCRGALIESFGQVYCTGIGGNFVTTVSTVSYGGDTARVARIFSESAAERKFIIIRHDLS